MSRIRLVVMGTPVAPGNRGVMALGASVVTIFESLFRKVDASFLLVHQPWSDVQIVGFHGERSVGVVTCRMTFSTGLKNQLFFIFLLSGVYRCVPVLRKRIAQFSPWIKCVSEADVVGDIRGGDSFSDIYGLKRFLLAALPVLSVLLVRGRIVHFPQTYGPFSTRLASWVGAFLLRRSSVLIARDIESQRCAEALVGSRQVVSLSPDVAFMLQKKVPSSIDASPSWRFQEPELLVGLNVNGLMYNGGYDRKDMFSLALDYPRFLNVLVVSILDRFSGEIVLVPHTYAKDGDVESDNEACWKLFKSLPAAYAGRVRVITGNYDQHEIKGVVGLCGMFIGSRMHACIAALSQGIPCVGVAYSRKFKGVFHSVGMDEWIVDGRTLDVESAVSKTLELFERRGGIATALRRNVELAQNSLREVFSKIGPAVEVH